eukprot:751208-Hanusia_phi.AAC.1
MDQTEQSSGTGEGRSRKGTLEQGGGSGERGEGEETRKKRRREEEKKRRGSCLGVGGGDVHDGLVLDVLGSVGVLERVERLLKVAIGG